MVDNLKHDVTDGIASVEQANKFATTFAHPAYRLAEDRLRALSDADVALIVRITGGLEPVDGRIQALVRGAARLEPSPTGALGAAGAEGGEADAKATLGELCATMRISAAPTDRQPPWQEADAAPYTGQGWNVRLGRGELGVNYSELDVPFWMGSAHGKTVPTASEVMDCLCSDAASIENAATGPYGAPRTEPCFEEWASDLGYDADSRRAEAIFKACGELADRLRAFLGSDYETFLWAERD